MKTVSMLELRQRAEAILKQVRKGHGFVLTYRGKPVARLEPLTKPEISEDDPIYHLYKHASATAEPLTNAEIDRIVYGQ